MDQQGQAAQIALARSLVGKRVIWCYVGDDNTDLFGRHAEAMLVESATPRGMVCIEGFGGEFAPHLFRVVS